MFYRNCQADEDISLENSLKFYIIFNKIAPCYHCQKCLKIDECENYVNPVEIM